MQNVAVIGCGAIGLTTALAIQNTQENVNVTIFTKDLSPNTTSDISAGFWEPFLVGNTPQDKIYRWSKITYDYLLRLWQEGKAAEAGITLIPAIYLTNEKNFILPNWLDVTLGYSQLSRDVLNKYSKKMKKTFTGGFAFLSFTWESTIFLPYFQKMFLKNGGKIVKRNINNFQELSDFELIINCTGLNSEKLVGDTLMKPIRGQVMRIKAPWIYHIIISDNEEPYYVIPNIHSVVLGGTKQESYNLSVDEADKRNILRNCSKLVPAVKSAEIIKHQVGLRPCRDTVRLENEIKGNEKDVLRIVHNYGHGGAGITLSVGCAEEAAELARKILRTRIKNKL